MREYTVEDLEITFKEHSEKAQEQHLKQRQRHELEHNEPYPIEFFDISEALHVICKEINEMKKQRSENIRCQSLNGLGNLPFN